MKDVVAFDLFQAAALFLGRLTGVAPRHRQEIGFDDQRWRRRQDDCSFDHVLQLANVAGPRVGNQALHRFVVNGFELTAEPLAGEPPAYLSAVALEELRRLIPVLKRLRGHLGVPVSVDTYKAEVAERALEHGAEIINDPSGLTFEPQLARVVSNHDAGLILNHMRGRPETWAKLAPVPDDLVLAVYTALRPRRATRAELDEWAERLEGHGANRTARFVREAADAYAERGLLADA